MIEVNLLPGGKKRQARRGPAFALPKFGRGGGGGGGLAQADRWMLGSLAVIALALGYCAWLFLGVSGDREEVSVALEEAVQDSSRFADLISRTNELTARRDSIASKVGIIQEIDQNRYTWPHVMDEVARSLPDYTWLAGITQVASDPLQFRIEGRAGNNFALTVFMEQLEASPFIEGVRLLGSQQAVEGADAAERQVVTQFQLEAMYSQPPMDFLETVPLFGGADMPVSTQDAQGAAPPTGGEG